MLSQFKKTIQKVSKKYECDNDVDEILLWEIKEMQIRVHSISFAKQKSFKQKNKKRFWKPKS